MNKREVKVKKQIIKIRKRCNDAGFGLIILIIAIGIIAMIAGMYYSKRVSKIKETKTQIIEQSENVEDQVERRMEDLQKKTLESMKIDTELK